MLVPDFLSPDDQKVFDLLIGRVQQQWHQARHNYGYYTGANQKMAFAQAKYEDNFKKIFEKFSDNFCGMIIDSITERTRVEGFRMTDEPAADKDAQEIWQRNFLDADSNSTHTDALVNGRSFLTVWADEDGNPTITPEPFSHIAVKTVPGSRRQLEAAVKSYVDEWGRQYATFWTPTTVYSMYLDQDAPGGWVSKETTANPLGTVPVIQVNTRSDLYQHPKSELSSIIPIQDMINKTVMDAAIASEFAAWPQRYVTGLEIQEDSAGRPIAPFQVAIDKLLQAESPEVKFGQFEAANLSNYVTLIEMLVQHLASISRIPFHYFLSGGGMIPSGDAITSAESGLVAKAQERMLYFGEAWEQAMRLAFQIKGDSRAEAFSAETIWRDPERRTEAQHIDSLVKLSTIGVPQRVLWEKAGFTPSEIERFDALSEEQAEKAKEMADKYGPDDPQTDNEDQAQKTAEKAPQGNSGNANRELAGK
ncbi:phage portal protein [Streptomyces sp. 769]|uniref:phage portal protein n=1 Tax=Streptomyces sp. 769 TaxID=1262452 RepID=UPI0005820AEF|nr:phage portal protein [Streptomyces sp. 769]AJC53988.1 hypothetical protein GZL_01388 [Streptomyces sp. 769]